MKYSRAAEAVIQKLNNAGESAYLVGGCVRDMLLCREAHDFDVTTSALPERVMEIFDGEFAVIPTGIKHGTVTVIVDGEPVEVTTYRCDGEYTDSRHPENVSFTDRLSDDLCRRDFTVNAMAYNKNQGVVDLFGGREDLDAKIIRCVGDAETRFSEDALRILRAFRFSSELDFEIEEKTLAGAAKCATGLENISRERVRAELSRLLLGKNAVGALSKMIECGVLEYVLHGDVLTELAAIEEMETKASKKTDSTDSRVDKNGKKKAELLLLRAERLCELPCVLPPRLGALFFGMSPLSAAHQMRSLRFSNAEISETVSIVGAAFTPCEESEVGARRFLSVYRKNYRDVLAVLAAYGRVSGRFSSLVMDEAAKNPCVSLDMLAVSGADLIRECGISGREVGNVLSRLLDAVIENPELNDRETLLDLTHSIAFDR